MRVATLVLSVVTVAAMAVDLVAQAKPSFAGEWKVAADHQGQPGVDLTIAQSATAVTMEYRDGGSVTYKLDGSASKNMAAGRAGAAPIEQVSKAMWVGSALVVTTTTRAGNEKRTFTTDGFSLVVETSTGAGVTKTTYQRYERGFGG